MKVRFKLSLAELCLAVYYAWFFLPYMRTVFTGSYKYIFFGFFTLGIGLLVLENVKARATTIKVQLSLPMIVLAYMTLMLFLFLFDVAEAGKHLRVSFTFWGTIFIFFLMGVDPEKRRRFGFFLLTIVVLTIGTSFIGILETPNAARAMASASRSSEALEQDYILGRKNIAGLALFQCMAAFSPIYVSMIKKKRKPWMGLLLLVLTAVIIASASFTICLLVFAMGICLGMFYKKGSHLRFGAIVVAFLFLMFLPWNEIFAKLASLTENQYIGSRLNEIAYFLTYGSSIGDMSLRINAYTYSISTFLAHPFGIGPHYSYVLGQNGIGYHSQILDDLARYGVTGLVFYLLFIKYYYKLIRDQWSKIGMGDVALPVVTLYGMFLLLNIAFRSSIESVIMLFLLPVLPEIVAQPLRNRKTRC